MPRHSAEKIADLALAGRWEKPAAPDDLNKEEAEEWRALVARYDPTKFQREVHALLSNYCRLTVATRYLARQRHLLEQGEFCLGSYNRLLKMEQDNSRVMSTLAVRLGFVQVGPYAKPEPEGAKPPWRK